MSNIHYDVVESDLEKFFSKFAPVKEIYIFYGPDGSSTGKGEVVFYNCNDAILVGYLLANIFFMGRFLRLKSVYLREVRVNVETFLFDNIPLDVTARDLKAHFRPPFRVTTAAVLYNDDGSSTGKAKVTFSDIYMSVRLYRFKLSGQCKIKDKVMGFSRLKASRKIESTPKELRYCVCQSIYITDLNYDVEANDIKEYLSKYFDVMEVTVFYNKDGTSTCTAEVTFYREKDMFPYIVKIILKLFEDRLDSVYFVFVEYEDIEGYNYQEMVDNHWEKDCEQVVNRSNNKNEDMECHKKVDEFILTRRIRSGKSLLHKTLRLKQFNSFVEQRCRERNYIPTLKLGIPEYQFDVDVLEWPYDSIYEAYRACTDPPMKHIVSTYMVSNRNGASTGTGLVTFKSRGENRLPCVLLIESKELSSKRFEMRCVPGLMKICWYYI